MSDQGSDESSDGPMAKKIKSQLECPVCLRIPRELPLPSCPSGHIVCQPCKTRVKNCPTCRQPMPDNMTNSLVGGLLEQLEFKCKYNNEGCQVKMRLKDIQGHEKKCPEGTIKCPDSACGSDVKLKDMNEHFLTAHPTPHSISFRLHDQSNKYMSQGLLVTAFEKNVSVQFNYSPPDECYALSFLLSTTDAEAAKYRVNLRIKDNDKAIIMKGLRLRTYDRDHCVDPDQCMELNGKYFWCIPFTVAHSFAIKTPYSINLLQVDFELKTDY